MLESISLAWLTLDGYACYARDNRLVSMIKESPAGAKDFSDVAIYCGATYGIADVLFLRESVGSGGETIINFRTIYNEDFKDDIKATGSARFRKSTSSWDVVISGDTESLDDLSNSINDFYPIVVFLNNGTIFKQDTPVDNASGSQGFTVPAIVPVLVSAVGLLAAYNALRANEAITRIAIFNGETFVQLAHGISAQVDLLLLRFDMAHIQPRYALYRVSTNILTIVSFRNSGTTRFLIADYAKSIVTTVFAPEDH